MALKCVIILFALSTARARFHVSVLFKARFHKAGLFSVCWLRVRYDFHLDLAVLSLAALLQMSRARC